jgi:hypothetical protein
VTGAVEYRLQVDNNSDFSSPEVNETALSTATHTPGTDLASNSIFYWRVRAWKDDGTNVLSNWSVVRSIRTAVLPPVLSSPADGVTLTTLRPTFDWNDVPGATGYTIQFSTSPTFSTIGHTGSPVASTYTPTVDLPKGKLYWRVQTRAVNGPSAWSSEWRWYQGPYPPAAPVLSLPANGSLTTDYTPTLKWVAVTIPAGAPTFTHYQVQVDDNSDFSSLVMDDTTITDRLIVQLDTIALVENKTYYWRVRAVDSLPENGVWSAVRKFSTAVLPPLLNMPVNGYVYL